MRNEMQRLRQLSNQLNNATDPDEINRIQEEIWEIESEMELYEDLQYDEYHKHQKNADY